MNWYKKSLRIIYNMYVSLVDEKVFENKQDVNWSIKNEGIKPEDIWIISYNYSALKDNQLVQSMWDRYHNGEYGKRTSNDYSFYVQLFAAASINAVNYVSGITKSSDETLAMIDEMGGGIPEFWKLVDINNNIYSSVRQEEEQEIKYTDDQLPGKYEEEGPDKNIPQY